MILFFILLTIVIVCGKYIHELHNFNPTANLVNLQNPDSLNIQELMKEKSPIIIHNLLGKHENLLSVSLNNLIDKNPGYIINDNNKYLSLSSFNEKEVNQMFVINNQNMIQDFQLNHSLDQLLKSFQDQVSCNLTHKLSILKGNQNLSLTQNKRNFALFVQFVGETTLYLFNPKHKEDIINKTNQEIKKWAIKIVLKPGIVLYLPPEWYYIYETKDVSILNMSECDNYFTWAYNCLR